MRDVLEYGGYNMDWNLILFIIVDVLSMAAIVYITKRDNEKRDKK